MAKKKQKPATITDDQIKQLADEICRKQGNVYLLAKELFGPVEMPDLFDRLESVGEAFRCDECSIWQGIDMKDPDYCNTCCDCANVNEHLNDR